MTIKRQITLVLCLLMLVTAGLSYRLLIDAIVPTFERLESNAAAANVARVEKAIRHVYHNLAKQAGDYAIWDETYAFVQGNHDTYAESNLTLTGFLNFEINIVLFYDEEKQLVWGMLLDLENERELTLAGLGINKHALDPFLNHQLIDSTITGALESPMGVALLASKPIVTTQLTGPIQGTLIFGKFLDEVLVGRLRSRTEVELAFSDLTSSGAITDVGAQLPLNAGSRVEAEKQSFRIDRRELKDIHGKAVSILEVRTPTDITKLGQQALGNMFASLAMLGIVVAIAIWLLLHFIVVNPLNVLGQRITQIKNTDDLTQRLDVSGHNEISLVASIFNELLDKLLSTRQELQTQSYKAGRAETASTVLHNIRNALTPLVNRAESASAAVSASSGGNMLRAAEELANNDLDQDRRSKLSEYLTVAMKEQQSQTAIASADLEVVSAQVRQVEQILQDQENVSQVASILETISLEGVVKEAATVLPNDSGMSIRVELEPELREFKIRSNYISLMQVLHNIIINAYESILRTQRRNGLISVSAHTKDSMVCLSITDDGAGIAEDMKSRLFARGISSKKSDLGGLGLHWCANTLANMGGKIRAESNGADAGAVFHLYLPAA